MHKQGAKSDAWIPKAFGLALCVPSPQREATTETIRAACLALQIEGKSREAGTHSNEVASARVEYEIPRLLAYSSHER